MNSRTFWGLGCCLLILVCTGCEKDFIVPDSDPTAPSIRLVVFGLGDPIELEQGGKDLTRSVPEGAEIVMVAQATDMDGGVKNVAINGEIRVNCSRDGIGQLSFITYVANNPEAPGTGIGDEAKQRRATNLKVTLSGVKAACRPGFTFQTASGEFSANAENFHGAIATSRRFFLTHP